MSDNDQPVDPLPALVAAMEQALMYAPMIARQNKALYDAHVEQGFTEKQALYLTAKWWESTAIGGEE